MVCSVKGAKYLVISQNLILDVTNTLINTDCNQINDQQNAQTCFYFTDFNIAQLQNV